MSLDFFFIPISILLIFAILSIGTKNEIKRTKYKKKYVRK